MSTNKRALSTFFDESWETRTGKDFEQIVPSRYWFLSEDERKELSSERELGLLETLEYMYMRASKYSEVLKAVCCQYCVRDDAYDNDEYSEGEAPLSANGVPCLVSALEVLGLKEGDPEYTVWPKDMFEDWQ